MWNANALLISLLNIIKDTQHRMNKETIFRLQRILSQNWWNIWTFLLQGQKEWYLKLISRYAQWEKSYTEKNGVSNFECQNLAMSVLYCR